MLFGKKPGTSGPLLPLRFRFENLQPFLPLEKFKIVA